MLPALCFTETWTFAGSELLAGKPDQWANAAGVFKSHFNFSPPARLPSCFGVRVTGLLGIAVGWGCWSALPLEQLGQSCSGESSPGGTGHCCRASDQQWALEIQAGWVARGCIAGNC